MKTVTSLIFGTLTASLLTLNVASAATPSNDEIFSAIDGEYEVSTESRVNFSLSSGGSNSPSLDSVLKGIDGEYGHAGINSRTSRHETVSELPVILD